MLTTSVEAICYKVRPLKDGSPAIMLKFLKACQVGKICSTWHAFKN